MKQFKKKTSADTAISDIFLENICLQYTDTPVYPEKWAHKTGQTS